MPVRAIHNFDEEIFDQDEDDKTYYLDNIMTYFKEDAIEDMNWIDDRIIEEEDETERALAEMQQGSSERIVIGKRDRPETSSPNPQVTKQARLPGRGRTAPVKNIVIPPGTKCGKVIGRFALFHKRMTDPDSYCSKRAIPFDMKNPETVETFAYKVIKFWDGFSVDGCVQDSDIVFREFAIEVLQEMPTSVLSESFWSECKYMETVNETPERFEERMMIKADR